MTTYNLNIANISFRSSLDSRDIQEEIDNIESLKSDYESDLESLNDELNDLESELYDIENDEYEQNDIDNKLEEIAEKENEVKECEFEYNSYSEELTELESLREEISDNSTEGFEYGIQLIHEDDIDNYLHELLIDCGYLPKDLPSCIEIDWQATYDNLKDDYSEIELNGNMFYVL